MTDKKHCIICGEIVESYPCSDCVRKGKIIEADNE